MNIIKNCKNYISQLSYFESKLENDFQQAISQGNSDLIAKLIEQNKFFISKPLPNGELPLNFAIMKSQKESIKALIDKGADVLMFDDQHLNALTTAYFKKDYTAIDQLLEHLIKDFSTEWKETYQRDKKAIKDSHGLNKFHYAAALRGKEIIKEAKDGVSQFEVKDDDTLTGLVKQLDQKSPLAMSKYDAAVFACTVALEIGQQFPSLMLEPRILQLSQLVHYSFLLQNFDKTSLLVSMLSFAGLNAHYFSESLAQLSTGINILLTMNLAYKTFKGLSSCWRNSSLSLPQALMKATVSHAPSAILSYKQLCSIGERFGLLAAPEKTPLQSLNERDIKCLKEKLDSGYISPYCLDKSHQAYVSCVNDSTSELCQNAEKTFDNYFIFKDINSYPKCEGNYNHSQSLIECTQKRSEWFDKCFGVSDTDENCQKAHNAFLSAEARNFSPDYNVDFWRYIFSKTNHACPTEKAEELLNCLYQRNTWKKACDSDVNFYSRACVRAEAIFRNNLEKGFHPKYPYDSWRSKAIRIFDCSKDIIENLSSKLSPLNMDSHEECNFIKQDWKEDCFNEKSEACKKAENTFIDGLKNKFAPNFSSNHWRKKELLKSFYCTDANTKIDCEQKFGDWQKECKVDLNSESCKTAEGAFKIGRENGFDSNTMWSVLKNKIESITNTISEYKDSFNREWKKLKIERRKYLSKKEICEEAIEKITGNKVDTLQNLKKEYRLKATILHPDKNSNLSKEMKELLSEELKELTEYFTEAKECIADATN
jgi:ankyrin repeat protein